MYAMDRNMLETFLKWFNTGTLSVHSHGVSDVVELFKKIDRILFCPLRFEVLPEETFKDCAPDGMGMGSVMMRTAYRLFLRILPVARKVAKGRLARLPLTKSETKKRVLTRHHEDETEAVRMLAARGSEACRILTKLHLDRPTIKLAHEKLREHRSVQVTLSSIICATRFKYADKQLAGVLRPTLCQICKRDQIDTFEHMMECIGLREIPEDQEFITDYLELMAKRALTKNPGIPAGFDPDPELCLVDYSDSSLEEISF